MVKKLSFDEAVEEIDRLPNEAEVDSIERVIRRTCEEDKDAVRDYARTREWLIMDE